MKLNFGCGNNILDGYENFDKYPINNKVKFIDLNKIPYPFEDNSIDKIILSHVLEHLQNPLDVMNECHRILKHDGIIIVQLPIKLNIISHYRDTHSSRYLNHFIIKKVGFHGSRSYKSLGVMELISFKKNGKRDLKNIYFIVKTRFKDFINGIFYREYIWELRKK